MSPEPEHLDPSELGTKEYWNTLYTRELSNHASDPSDTGTSWFDDSDAERKTTQFLESLSSAAPLAKDTASVLDLGCGNGSMLFALRDEGWTGRALGVDYSPQSVALAKAGRFVAGCGGRRGRSDGRVRRVGHRGRLVRRRLGRRAGGWVGRGSGQGHV
ncbi:Lysine methyltransferase [Metarhizium acridum]|uniref:Lysine methyltransferase n=1 Tax=Metarhizium acridum TaxID=92637 RepID=UPI001C6CFFA6|nr:Lysine methyltransferase [Metarhizium acridum]